MPARTDPKPEDRGLHLPRRPGGMQPAAMGARAPNDQVMGRRRCRQDAAARTMAMVLLLFLKHQLVLRCSALGGSHVRGNASQPASCDSLPAPGRGGDAGAQAQERMLYVCARHAPAVRFACMFECGERLVPACLRACAMATDFAPVNSLATCRPLDLPAHVSMHVRQAAAVHL